MVPYLLSNKKGILIAKCVITLAIGHMLFKTVEMNILILSNLACALVFLLHQMKGY